jgi:hypothetical protein
VKNKVPEHWVACISVHNELITVVPWSKGADDAASLTDAVRLTV